MEKSAYYERVFNHFDTNGDGKISPSELQQCITAVSGDELISVREAKEAVECFDSDGDGLLELTEFVSFVDGGGEDEKVRELKEAFKMYEMEGSGKITATSLKKMLRKLGDDHSRSLEDCKIMIAKFDLNGDGVIDFDEFKVMML